MSTAQEDQKKISQRRRELWKKVLQAGGKDAYIYQQLEAKGFSQDPVNTEWMSDTEKQEYKEKKRKEAQTRQKLQKEVWKAYQETHLVHLGEGVFYNDLVDFDRFDHSRS